MHIFKRRRKRAGALDGGRREQAIDRWTSAGMRLTFRAELMPGRDPGERTFEVARILASGRVELKGLAGQHTETEFEATTTAPCR
ncbi:MAG TPA: hypothetical protein VGC64_04405 [Pyrinomonadaceae bacterium]|jgi:hypothetical protein